MVEEILMNRLVSERLFSDQTANLQNQRLLQLRQWSITTISYPQIDLTFNAERRISLRIRLLCEDWDSKPPSVELLYADGKYLTRLPRGSGVLNGGPHPLTGRPFVCTAGTLEYHTHPSHIADYWENYKEKSGFDLGGIISQIWSAWGATHD